LSLHYKFGSNQTKITDALHENLQLDIIQGGSNMTGTDLYVNKPHCSAAVRP